MSVAVHVADAGGRCPCGRARCAPGCRMRTVREPIGAARDPFGLWDLLGESLDRVEHLLMLRDLAAASDALRAAQRYAGWLRQDRAGREGR